MEIRALIQDMANRGVFTDAVRNPRAQFGTRTRRFLGAELMPERVVDNNSYPEDTIRWRTLLALAATRYSPPQKRGSALIGSFRVTLGNSNIANELTASDLDAIMRILGRNLDAQAAARVTDFVNTTIVLGLVEFNEKQRWDAIVDAQAIAKGDNEYSETINYANPTGHRLTPAGAWSNVAVDPFVDIFTLAGVLQGKGYTVTRIISTRNVVGIMGGNPNVSKRTGRVGIDNTGNLFGFGGRPSLTAINGALSDDGLPNIELYDERYATETGTGRFLKNDAMVLVCATGRDENVDLGDTIEVISDTLGYVGIGTTAGQPDAGRQIRTEYVDRLPPHFEAEGAQVSAPVITEPEAFGVVKGIT